MFNFFVRLEFNEMKNLLMSMIEDPKFGSTEVQIKLSRESGKKGSFSS